MEFVDAHKEIRNSITRSQHCQRNWDLTKDIPKEDFDLILHAATQCPSKQNNAYYKIYAVTNREVIEKIHDSTVGFTVSYEPMVRITNSQTLANLLLVYTTEDINRDKFNVNEEYVSMHSVDLGVASSSASMVERDATVALGISSGYVNLTASLLGYSTGCCQCFNGPEIMKILGTDQKPVLLMGIGYKSSGRNRREHHKEDYVFPTFKRSEIDVNIIS